MFAIILAALAVDFTAATGEIRPELHSSGFGPKICSQTAQELADIKSMGSEAARRAAAQFGKINDVVTGGIKFGSGGFVITVF